MNYNVEVDINTIYGLSEDIKQEGNVFIEKLDNLLSEVEKVNECFDSETGKMLKEKFIEVIKRDKEYIANKYISYSTTVKNIGDIYSETNKEISNSMK